MFENYGRKLRKEFVRNLKKIRLANNQNEMFHKEGTRAFQKHAGVMALIAKTVYHTTVTLNN